MARNRPRRPGRGVDKTGRSKGEGQYALLPYALLQSEAWRTLGGASVKVFLELRTRFNGGNNGKLFVSLEEAADLLELGKATVLRAFNELEANGLIVCTRKGKWYGRQATEWAVTDQRIDGAAATHAWRNWQPEKLRPSVLKWTDKRSAKNKTRFSNGPQAPAIGSEMDRRAINGSISEPVSAIRLVAIGSEMDRY